MGKSWADSRLARPDRPIIRKVLDGSLSGAAAEDARCAKTIFDSTRSVVLDVVCRERTDNACRRYQSSMAAARGTPPPVL